MKAPDLEPPGRRGTMESRTPYQRYSVALGAIVIAFLLRLALDPLFKDRYPFSTVAISIILVAWYAGFVPSLWTFFVGFVLVTWFFLPPRHSFMAAFNANLAGQISFAFIALAIIFFGRSLHLARQRADANAREAIDHQKQLEREVAERKRAEEEVRNLNQELEQRVIQRTAELVATNQELESFTYSVSHDLRAPLRHVDGYAQILEEEFGGKMLPAAQNLTKKIRQGSQNMGRLVDDLLNLSRVGKKELSRREVPLNSVVDEVVKEIKLELDNRQVEWRIGPLPAVECDVGLMKQVFINLLSNAVKYTRPREQAVVEIGEIRTNGEAAFFVRDNGVGFNMKYAGKLFGVFQRLHRAEEFEGTGVGLATVARIIHKHGGRIWVEAEKDKGASFFFTVAPASVATVSSNGHTGS